MSYGLRYICEFTSIAEVNYKVEIYKKDYSDTPTRVMGSGVVQTWDEDDPQAPIRGSKLTVNLINSGSLPLSTFYSPNDDEYKAILLAEPGNVYYGSWQKLFEGFLVQDDCIEDMVDYNHPITLVFTDNLGLLKEVRLGDQLRFPLYLGGKEYEIASTADPDIFYIKDMFTDEPFQIGDVLEVWGLVGGPAYTVVQVVDITAPYTYQLTPTSTGGVINFTPGNYFIIREGTLIEGQKPSLFTILQACLTVTGLQIGIKLYLNIYHIFTYSVFPSLLQTFINRETYMVNDHEYDTCWNVLERLLKPLRLTLFQANGRWIIKKWDEIQYKHEMTSGSTGAWRAYYFEPFTYLGQYSVPEPEMIAGVGMSSVAENGFNRRIERPFEFSKERFEYRFPNDVLKNINLDKLGAQIRYYTVFDVILKHVYEYQFNHWTKSTLASPFAEIYIRVVKDGSGNELERYAVVKENLNPAQATVFFEQRMVHAIPIEINKGDVVNFSFSYRTNISVTGPNNSFFAVELNNGGSFTYASPDGWFAFPLGRWGYLLPIGADSNQWQSVSIRSTPAPTNGILTVFLAAATVPAGFTGDWQTHYKDMRFSIEYFVSDQTKITGHIHTDKQSLTIRNNEDKSIYMDDSPRNSIAGTLFVPGSSSGVRERTIRWLRYNGDTNQPMRLGEMATKHELLSRSKPNTILEGNIFNIIKDGMHFTPDSLVKYTYFPNLSFAFGRLELDYNNNILTGTLYEVKDDEYPSVINEYTFVYTYNSKP